MKAKPVMAKPAKRTLTRSRTTPKAATAAAHPPPNSSEPINWERAAASFKRLVQREAKEIVRLSDARTYANG